MTNSIYLNRTKLFNKGFFNVSISALVLLICLHANNLYAGIGDLTVNGWTILRPSANTRIFYVDATNGDDATAQYLEAYSTAEYRNPVSVKAYKTIKAAAAAVRDGYPDWILLKRGETWTDEFLDDFKSGLNAEEPIVISYYGNSGERPLIRNTEHFINHNGRTKSNLVLQGLHFYNYKQDPKSPEFDANQSGTSIRMVGGGENILIEDCKLEFYELVFDAYNGEYKNIHVRRSIIVDTYYNNSAKDNKRRPSGLYASGVHGLFIEDCVFDHNGWNEDVTNAAANMYNHNIYIQYDCSNTVVRNSIILRGAANGVQLRGCGIAEENLFVQNAVALNLGYHGHESEFDTIAIAKNNVILEGRDMDPDGVTGNLSSSAVWGIWTSYERFVVENNIVANRLSSATNVAFPNDHGAITSYVNNIVHNWEQEVDSKKTNWLDPSRSVASYHGTLGKTATFEAFASAVRKRSLGAWPKAYQARTVNNYIREGFSKLGNNNPKVSFSHSEIFKVPTTIDFKSSASDPDGDTLSYIWKIEDAWFYEDGSNRLLYKGFSTELDASYTFTYPGTYKVSLTVYDGKGGSHTSTKSLVIKGNYPPISDLKADVVEGSAPLLVNFDASGSSDQNGDELTYHFDFGDGFSTKVSGNAVSHVFSPGTYNVTMYARDEVSSSYTKNIIITVSDPTTSSTSVSVEADALLDAEKPDENFGTVYNSRITDADKHGIFRVDFSEVKGEVVSAKLHIVNKYGKNPCAVKYIADDSWGETSVTWNNQPRSANELAKAEYTDSHAVFNITEKVKVEDDKKISVLLYEQSNEWQEFRYRETSYAVPYLEIVTKTPTTNASPVANIKADVVEGILPLTVNFNASESTDVDGDKLNYTWNFGDGSDTATEEQVQHVFESAGSYQVTLIVDDGQGEQNGSRSYKTLLIKVKDVKNTSPDARIITDVTTGVAPLAINFDASESTDEDGDELSYTWDFGDGSSEETTEKVAHTYATKGIYTVTLTVDDGRGDENGSISTAQIQIKVDEALVENRKPEAKIKADVTEGYSPLTIKFDASESTDADGDALTYTWDFGDDSEKKIGEKVEHVFQAVGTYIVTLIADDGHEGEKKSKAIATLQITVKPENKVPVAKIVTDLTKGYGPLTVNFDASGSTDADGHSLTYTWDFGDGSESATGEKVKHTFDKEGSYSVVLIVDDGQGAANGGTSFTKTTITVEKNTAPVAVFTTDITEGTAPLRVKFDASGSSDADNHTFTCSWDFGDDSPVLIGEKVQHTFRKEGVYVATLTVDDGQGEEKNGKSIATAMIRVDKSLGSAVLKTTSDVKLFPNPVSHGNLSYTLPNVGYRIKIIGSNGNTLVSEVAKASGIIDVSMLKAGVYFFVAKRGKEIRLSKFIVQK